MLGSEACTPGTHARPPCMTTQPSRYMTVVGPKRQSLSMASFWKLCFLPRPVTIWKGIDATRNISVHESTKAELCSWPSSYQPDAVDFWHRPPLHMRSRRRQRMPCQSCRTALPFVQQPRTGNWPKRRRILTQRPSPGLSARTRPRGPVFRAPIRGQSSCQEPTSMLRFDHDLLDHLVAKSCSVRKPRLKVSLNAFEAVSVRLKCAERDAFRPRSCRESEFKIV